MSKIDIVNEMHKNARVNFPRRRVIMRGIDDLWQADLMDMHNISKENHGFNFILAVIDTFSKYAWVRPLRQKTSDCICKAFDDIFKSGRIPKKLQTDHGTEFYNHKFKELLKKHNVNLYSTYSSKKACIAERFIRTFKGKMYKLFSLKGNYKWNDTTLFNLIHEYNNTLHRTIGLKPIEVEKHNEKSILDKYNITEVLKRMMKNKFKVGDFVRISKYKGMFEKGYTPNWSAEIFKIIKVQQTKPLTFLLEDSRKQPIAGAFYEQELLKTKNPHLYLIQKILKRKGSKIFVKWLGLPSSENSWINKSSII